jgi:hypothetical protein
VVTLADLADHVVETRRQLVKFMDAAAESLNVMAPDRDLGHVLSQGLQRLDQPGHQPSLQPEGQHEGQRNTGADQPEKEQATLM